VGKLPGSTLVAGVARVNLCTISPYVRIRASINDESQVSLDFIQSRIADDMHAVDAVIRRSLHSEVALINQVADYIVNSGGKRLRPALVLLSAGVFGKIAPAHHELAAIVEFIHTATLLHDDVVDESSMRRGRETANTLFGNAASVLVGDFIYSRAFQMMVNIQNMRVMEVLAEATNIIAEGEVLQLLNIHDADVTDEAYLKVINYKTAKLFEAATRLGAIICNASEKDEQAMAAYGMRLGTAFQLIDDVLDLSGDSNAIGKNLGDDLAEGKPTLPLLFAMRNGNAQQRATIRHAIEQGGLEELPTVIQAVKETGALEHVRKLARQEADIGCAAIANLPTSDYHEALINLANFSVDRAF
jgi:octaprenyl-diphosphate synthase